MKCLQLKGIWQLLHLALFENWNNKNMCLFSKSLQLIVTGWNLIKAQRGFSRSSFCAFGKTHRQKYRLSSFMSRLGKHSALLRSIKWFHTVVFGSWPLPLEHSHNWHAARWRTQGWWWTWPLGTGAARWFFVSSPEKASLLSWDLQGWSRSQRPWERANPALLPP